MKHFLFVFGILFLLSCNKETTTPESLDLYSVTSVYTNQKYQIKVVLPDNYSTAKEYPIVYLTDGFLHFNTVVNVIKKKKNEIEDIILVSIFYEDYPFSASNATKIGELRAIDLTYPVDESQAEESVSGGGGALLFHQFLEEELIPIIESNYSIDTTQRTIAGHSLGGYFSLFQLFKFTDQSIFPNVISLSPSIYWADLNLMHMEEDLYEQPINLPYNIYLGIGELEGAQNNVLFDKLVKNLETHKHSGLTFHSDRYSGGHIHSNHKGFKHALQYFF